ncbi:uncharacterized protein CG13380-like [Drosophila subobscura]|uniref:uncharacterized protein CG13380-like n=1 Tax=Drosophila subobscura TaxID=7241 RepID=UPI00155A809A|nr:uncharacterized protein CG13380-like [Drosophila subobscura]
MEGTDQNSIFARLNARYGNLTASSPRDVINFKAQKMSMARKRSKNVVKEHVDVDVNSNVELVEQQYINPNMKSKKTIVKTCICERPGKSLKCGRCHQSFHGRIGAKCEKHPEVAFLMDFRECPYCGADSDVIKELGSDPHD